MKQNDLLGNNTKNKTKFDPRTKILLLLTMSVFVLGGAGGNAVAILGPTLSTVPLILFFLVHKFRAALMYITIYAACLIAQILLLPVISGLLNYVILAVCSLFLRFMPSIMMGYFVISTTTVSEFVAAMELMRVTKKIVIPMSVVFRFFPTVVEEYSAISDAMRMRGIGLSGGKPMAIMEYRFIPMMICSLKIGEELSAAALTRGLGAPGKRTNICRIGFHVQDILAIVLCGLSFIYYLINVTGIW